MARRISAGLYPDVRCCIHSRGAVLPGICRRHHHVSRAQVTHASDGHKVDRLGSRSLERCGLARVRQVAEILRTPKPATRSRGQGKATCICTGLGLRYSACAVRAATGCCGKDRAVRILRALACHAARPTPPSSVHAMPEPASLATPPVPVAPPVPVPASVPMPPVPKLHPCPYRRQCQHRQRLQKNRRPVSQRSARSCRKPQPIPRTGRPPTQRSPTKRAAEKCFSRSSCLSVAFVHEIATCVPPAVVARFVVRPRMQAPGWSSARAPMATILPSNPQNSEGTRPRSGGLPGQWTCLPLGLELADNLPT